MEITELRIGNIISHSGKVCQVLGMNQTGEFKGEFCNHELVLSNGYCEASLNHCAGVGLSEEILLKAGFVRTKVPMKSDIEYIDYRMGQFVLFILPKGIVEVEFCAAHNKIEERGYLRAVKYLHQLQNLYFDLTGSELNTAGLV